MPLRGPLPLPIDIVAAAAGADGKGFLREFLAEAPGLRAGPDFPEGLVPHVADEIVGEVAAETDLAVRLDLSEVPRDRAPVVAECLAEVGEVLGDSFGRHVRDEGDPGAAERGISVPPAAQALQELDEVGHLLRLCSFRAPGPGELEALPGGRRHAEGLPHD